MIKPGDYIIVEGIEPPEWLLDAMYAEKELSHITDPRINDYMKSVLRDIVFANHPDATPSLWMVCGHVHVGIEGVTPHDHLPYHLTSILYLLDAEGELVVDPDNEALEIKPRQGRMVIIRGDVIHLVKPSINGELRAALVSNYLNGHIDMEFFKQ